VATLTLFHSHSSTGNGGSVTVPSGWRTGMPSASCQCSKLICVGMMLPVAKLPGRRLMLTTASSGNSVKASSTHSAACAAHTRQRWLLPVTMGIGRPSSVWPAAAAHRVCAFCVKRSCASAIAATIRKISVEIAAARPKFWPLSVKAMR